MRIHFNGAAQTVTGSQFLLEIQGKKILLECGLFQGRRSETYKRNRNFSFDPRTLDAVILSHAHIDHSGNLPNLIKHGYDGPIFATPATVDLAEIMLLDSGHIQEADVEFLNKKRARKGEPPVEPLYTKRDAEQVKGHFRSVDYGKVFEPVQGISACLTEAGHILGSASIQLEVDDSGRRKRLWFSGDIGRYDLPLLRDPILPDGREDILIMECTYGDKTHEPIDSAYEEFRTVVQDTTRNGGKVIIPAFSIGRTQELVYSLNRMISNKDLEPLPVFVDSPLAINASEIFSRHPECFDQETHAFIREHRHPALEFKTLSYTRSVEESKAINSHKGSAIIISASGMAEAGRILHHLRNHIGDPKNTVMIVSWQAPHTLGRRLAERRREVRIFGETHKCRARIATIGGFSAHAGQRLLMEYAMTAKGNGKKIFLVHGEEKSAYTLIEKLRDSGVENLYYPSQWDTAEIEL